MITIIAWILLVAVSLILLVSVAVLFWKPEEKAPVRQKQVSSYHPGQLSEEEKEEHDRKRQRFLQEADIRWKDLKPVVERKDLNDVILFHWKGLHGRKKVLFSLTDEEVQKAFFEAVSLLNVSSLIPDIDFTFAVPLKENPAEVSYEILEWCRKQNNMPDLVICCRNGLRDMPGLSGTEALVGIGEKPSVLYQVHGDNAESDWMVSLHPETIAQPVWNEPAERMVQAIRKHLPWQLSLELHLPFLYRKKAMLDLMTLYPDTKEWFLPKVEKRGDQLYVSAYDELLLKQAEAQIEASALKHSVHLEKIYENRMHLHADLQGESYQMVTDAITSAMETDAVIPVLEERKENEEDYTPVETVSFSPLMAGRRISFQGAVSFYENVLRKGI